MDHPKHIEEEIRAIKGYSVSALLTRYRLACRNTRLIYGPKDLTEWLDIMELHESRLMGAGCGVMETIRLLNDLKKGAKE